MERTPGRVKCEEVECFEDSVFELQDEQGEYIGTVGLEINAMRIVRAVNCHERLVEACEELINCIEGRLSEDCDISAVRDARAALALAEGRE